MLMGGAQIKNFKGLLGALNEGTTPVAKLLWSRFSAADREALEAVALAGTDLSERDEGRLMSAINLAMQGPSLYDAQAFRSVRLRPETKAMVAKPDDAVELNRLLLEDAFREYLVLGDGA